MSEFINTIDILGDEAVATSIIDRSITEFKDDVLTEVGFYAFNGCTALTAVDLPNCTVIQGSGFRSCSAITELNLPKVTSIAQDGLNGLTSLTQLYLPSVINLTGMHGITGCSKLTHVILPSVTKIGNYAITWSSKFWYLDCGSSSPVTISFNFQNSNLKALIIRSTTVSTLSTAFNSSIPIAKGTGYIYVPSALVDSYKAATNWSTYADQFRALEDYTVDGTITGEFCRYTVTYHLNGVTSSNTRDASGSTYQTTLVGESGNAPDNIMITMGGVDITADVYDAETGEVEIPQVTGDLVIQYIKANTLFYERGSIAWDGANAGYEITESTVSVATDFVPFINGSAVSIESANGEKYETTLRGYDASKKYQKANGAYIKLPAAVSFDYPYLRFIIRKQDGSNIDATTLNGATLCVGEQTYTLVLKGA